MVRLLSAGREGDVAPAQRHALLVRCLREPVQGVLVLVLTACRPAPILVLRMLATRTFAPLSQLKRELLQELLTISFHACLRRFIAQKCQGEI